jgi:hypothetical protein
MDLAGLSLSLINSIYGRLFRVQLQPRIDKPQEPSNGPLLEDALRRLQGHSIEIASLIDIFLVVTICSSTQTRFTSRS